MLRVVYSRLHVQDRVSVYKEMKNVTEQFSPFNRLNTFFIQQVCITT